MTFTISGHEAVAAIDLGYEYESAMCAFKNPQAGTTGVHRFFNNSTRGHLYTISDHEKQTIESQSPSQWTYEGVKFFVYELSNKDSTDLVDMVLANSVVNTLSTTIENKTTDNDDLFSIRNRLLSDSTYVFNQNDNQVKILTNLQTLKYIENSILSLQQANLELLVSAEYRSLRRFINAMYITNLRSIRYTGNMTDLEILSAGSDFLARYWTHDPQMYTVNEFESDLATAFSNRDGEKCVISGEGCYSGSTREAFFVGNLGDTGFGNIFRDTKYSIYDPLFNQSHQPFHLIGGGVNFAFAGDSHCYFFICKTNFEWMTWHETAQKGFKQISLNGQCGSSYEDLFLSYEGINLGELLRTGNLTPKTFGSEILSRLSRNDWSLNAYILQVPISNEWDIKYDYLEIDRIRGYTNATEELDNSNC